MPTILEEAEQAWVRTDFSPAAHYRDDIYNWACEYGEWLLKEVRRLRNIETQARAEHFRSNESQAVVSPYEHERSILNCQHPLCLELKRK